MSDKNAVQVLEMDDAGVKLSSLEDAYRFSKMVVQSGLAPKGLNKPEQVLVAIQAGAELGFSPMRALSSIAVINGKPSLMGDAAKSLVLSSGLLEQGSGIHHRYEGEQDELCCIVTSQRRGVEKPYETSFSVAQAKRAKLWGKSGPWTEYPHRMLYYRALGFHLRDGYSDALMGMVISEEAGDYPRRTTVTVEKPSEPDPLLSLPAAAEIEAEREPEPQEPELDPDTGEEIPDYIGREPEQESLV